jgi:hypothetical protein
MLNLCGIVVAILKMATGRKFSIAGINSGHHNLHTYEMSLKSDNVEFVRYCGGQFWKWRPVEICQCRESIQDFIIYPHIKFWWYRTMLNLCCIVAAILKMATDRHFSMLGINSGHHYLPTYQILMILGNAEFLPPICYTVSWQPFWTCRIAPLMVTYHYVKFFVSIIIHLEVININARNFNFPLGLYSNPHPLWTPQNMTLTPLPQSWNL